MDKSKREHQTKRAIAVGRVPTAPESAVDKTLEEILKACGLESLQG